jgi:hypothetical protein
MPSEVSDEKVGFIYRHGIVDTLGLDGMRQVSRNGDNADFHHRQRCGSRRSRQRLLYSSPLVAEPDYSGVFDPDLSPSIYISGLDITFKMEDIPGSEYIRVDEDEELYIVNWKTDTYDFEIPGVYRMSFRLGDEEIGYIEIEVFETPQEVVSQGDVITTVIQPGRTIPIKFRIETEPAR